METRTSQELLRQQDGKHLIEPPAYHYRPDVQGLFRGAIPIMLLGIVILIGLEWFLPTRWYYYLIPLVAAYFAYREFYKWRHEDRYASAKDGLLYIKEKQHPFILFFITGSDTDGIPLEDLDLKTPRRTFFDAYVFHCCTLVIGKRKIRDVVNVDGLHAIQKFQNSLARHEAELSQDHLEVDLMALMNLEQVVGLLTEIRDLLRAPGSAPAYPQGMPQGGAGEMLERLRAESPSAPARTPVSEDDPS